MGLFCLDPGARSSARSVFARRSLRCLTLAGAMGLALLGPTLAYADPQSHGAQAGVTAPSFATQPGETVPGTVRSDPAANLLLPAGESAEAAPATPSLPASIIGPVWLNLPFASFIVGANGIVSRDVQTAPILQAPYRNQFDGTAWGPSNCGPTSLAMALGALQINASQLDLRDLANQRMRDFSPNNGTTWDSLAYAASLYGATPTDLRVGRAYRHWTLDDLTQQLAQGRPVLLLVRYWDLPDHVTSGYGGDHYIVALGVDPDGNIIYNDPASKDGVNRTITPRDLNLAWSNTSEGLVRTAMALSL